jgi:hypothetical protein
MASLFRPVGPGSETFDFKRQKCSSCIAQRSQSGPHTETSTKLCATPFGQCYRGLSSHRMAADFRARSSDTSRGKPCSTWWHLEQNHKMSWCVWTEIVLRWPTHHILVLIVLFHGNADSGPPPGVGRIRWTALLLPAISIANLYWCTSPLSSIFSQIWRLIIVIYVYYEYCSQFLSITSLSVSQTSHWSCIRKEKSYWIVT